MKIEIGEVFPAEIEQNGTVMDYVDGAFIFVIKDDEWTPFEIEALHKRSLHIDFAYKFDIAIFLLTLDDAIDTSDFIFNVHDNAYDDSLYRENETYENYSFTLYLIDEKNCVCAKRSATCTKQMSECITSKLREQRDREYNETEFLCNLEGLQSAYEPFEMQTFSLISESYK